MDYRRNLELDDCGFATYDVYDESNVRCGFVYFGPITLRPLFVGEENTGFDQEQLLTIATELAELERT